MAMLFRKGSGWHGAAGTAFFVSMLAMSSSAALIAMFHTPNMMNVVAALLTFYLVSTSWRAAKERSGGIGRFDVAAMLFIAAVGVGAVAHGTSAAGRKSGFAFVLLIFAGAALLAAARDFRMIRRGGFTGPQRISRHLLRMCFAFLIALMSFFPGQAKLFPPALRQSGVLMLPHLLLIGSMVFWGIRMRRQRMRQNKMKDVERGEGIAGSLAGV